MFTSSEWERHDSRLLSKDGELALDRDHNIDRCVKPKQLSDWKFDNQPITLVVHRDPGTVLMRGSSVKIFRPSISTWIWT